MKLLSEMWKCHQFFVRKSQHYVLGNWSEYVPWSKTKAFYFTYYPIAYVKFMYYSFRDRKFYA